MIIDSFSERRGAEVPPYARKRARRGESRVKSFCARENPPGRQRREIRGLQGSNSCSERKRSQNEKRESAKRTVSRKVSRLSVGKSGEGGS